MIIVPTGYGIGEFFDISEVNGGTPYGASTIAGGDGSRQPSPKELTIARYQGELVAKTTGKLRGRCHGEPDDSASRLARGSATDEQKAPWRDVIATGAR